MQGTFSSLLETQDTNKFTCEKVIVPSASSIKCFIFYPSLLTYQNAYIIEYQFFDNFKTVASAPIFFDETQAAVLDSGLAKILVFLMTFLTQQSHFKFLTYPKQPLFEGVGERNPQLCQKVYLITPTTCAKARLTTQIRLKVKGGRSYGIPLYTVERLCQQSIWYTYSIIQKLPYSALLQNHLHRPKNYGLYSWYQCT